MQSYYFADNIYITIKDFKPDDLITFRLTLVRN